MSEEFDQATMSFVPKPEEEKPAPAKSSKKEEKPEEGTE